MKRYLLSLAFLLSLTACSPSEEETSITGEEEETEIVPTEEDRDAFLDSNEFIIEYEHSDDGHMNFLTINMKKNFTQKKISEQYLYLVEFYGEYNEKFGKLGSLNQLDVYFKDTEFPTYKVFLRTFSILGANILIDREIGQKPRENILDLLDTIDKTQLMSGTHAGLTLAEEESGESPPIKETLISSEGKVIGALKEAYGRNTR